MKYWWIIILVLLAACKEEEKDSIIPPITVKSYSPPSLGVQFTYQVDSIAFDDFTGTSDSIRYFERRSVVEQFENLEGSESYKLEIARRLTDSLDWQVVGFSAYSYSDRGLEINRNNMVLLSLVLPILEQTEWNINALNSDMEEDWIYSSVGNSYSTDFGTYPNTLISEADDLNDNLLKRELKKRVYAEGLGLIYEAEEDLNLEFSSGEILSGFKKVMQLKEIN